ncbi:signal transduction histidine kinase [Rathayibacter sp. PhB93]|uniref:ATP-binding protein n=1 Tax=unclassified Rathayibacter TaxID=2609250 RepID=UPI000FAFF772|nr:MULTISPECIES: HAMP domain-containing sensor histidine kinase [unclassified Rathayibacter]ROQ03709.1 signal transduction histidine kinase [Rathayibacter sp. PhB93]
MSDLGPMTLSVHPTVVFKLGEDLITDDLQALVELIKNSYDAGSPGAEVSVDTRVWTDAEGGDVPSSVAEQANTEAARLSAELVRLLPATYSPQLNLSEDDIQFIPALLAASEELLASTNDTLSSNDANQVADAAALLRSQATYLRGRIIVADAGSGMDRTDIERGWLTVSASPKRELKRRMRNTPVVGSNSTRTPLGDKGLGRLGVQRLGRVVDLVTRTQNSAPLACTIDWARFHTAHALRDINIDITRAPEETQVGTAITIRGLSSLDAWSNVRGLQAKLAELISPYSPARGFRVRFRLNGESIDLQNVSQRVLDASAVRYLLDYRDGVLTIRGSVRAEFLLPDRDEDKTAEWERLIRPDNGFAFLEEALASGRRLSKLGVEHGDDQRFCHFTTEVVLADVEAEADLDQRGRPELADPGPFTARVDVLQRRAASSHFDSSAEFRSWIKEAAGVRIYRDGFGIRTKSDWLNFERWMTGLSYYAIRPSNVIGYVDIGAQANAQLEETTSREEFRDTAHFRNFVRLFGHWLSITEEFQTALGRDYLDYVKKMTPTPAGITPTSTSAEIGQDIKHALGQVSAAAENVQKGEFARQNLTGAADALVAEAETLEREIFSDPGLVARVRDLARQVTEAIEQLNAATEPVRQAAAESVERRNSVDLLLGRLQEARDQVSDGWELMSLGITAETVSHEILNLTGRLGASSRQIAKYNDMQLRDARMGTYVEHVRSTTQSLQKQASRMDASLRYVRERRALVDVGDLSRRLVSYFEEAATAPGIQFEVVERTPLRVKTSEGKLSQALDNLLLNASYWVNINGTDGHEPRIRISIDAPYLTVEDNGPGVEKSVEAALWDPFTTRKPRGVGRGLGLFVTKQLLETEGLIASLDHERNDRGNRFRFRVDFTHPLEGE